MTKVTYTARAGSEGHFGERAHPPKLNSNQIKSATDHDIMGALSFGTAGPGPGRGFLLILM